VAGESGNEQHTFELGMPVDYEVVVGRIVVDAHSRFADSRIRETRYELGEKRSTALDELLAYPFIY
jgi:hypothetical protein